MVDFSKLFETEDAEAAARNYLARLAVNEVDPQTGLIERNIVPELKLPVQGVHDYVAPTIGEVRPFKWVPSFREGIGNVENIIEEGSADWPTVKDRLFGSKVGKSVNALSGKVRVEPDATFVERFQMWPEKMVRSGVSLPFDVMANPGMLSQTPASDLPGATSPYQHTIERAQDLAGLAAGGSVVSAGAAKPKAGTLAARLTEHLEDSKVGTTISGVKNSLINKPLEGAANLNKSQAEIIAELPGPTPFPERLWKNYSETYTPDEVLGSEPVWSGARRLAEERLQERRNDLKDEIYKTIDTKKENNLIDELNTVEHFLDGDKINRSPEFAQAFSEIANGFWKEQNANKHISPDLARAHIKRELSGFKLMDDAEAGTALSATRNSLANRLNEHLNEGQSMPEILQRQRASEGYEAAIRDSETKKVTSGMWHEEVVDKIAKEKGVPREEISNLVSSPVRGNLVKGYIDHNGKFWTEQQLENKSRSRTAMFRSDDEAGTAISAFTKAEQDILQTRVRPALRNLETGEIIQTSRGNVHEDIGEKHNLKFLNGEDNLDGFVGYVGNNNVKYDRGFYDPKEKKFHNADNLHLDATDLMTPTQRMRKFGTFSDDIVGTGLAAVAPRFYSGVEKAIQNVKADKALPEQWLGPKTERTYIQKDPKTGKEKTVTEVKYSGTIGNMPGVTVEEIEHLRLPQWIDEQKAAGKKSITRDELQKHLNDNKVELQEIWKGKNKLRVEGNNVVDLNGNVKFKGRSFEDANEALSKLNEIAEIQNRSGTIGPDTEANKYPPRFAQYQLPGGENYRELLLSVKDNPGKVKRIEEINNELITIQQQVQKEMLKKYGKEDSRLWTDEENKNYNDMVNDLEEKKFTLVSERNDLQHKFTVPEHWPGVNDIAVHSRMNDRFIPDENGPSVNNDHLNYGIRPFKGRYQVYKQTGEQRTGIQKFDTQAEAQSFIEAQNKKGLNSLHVEEIQSDWAQKGNSEGFKYSSLKEKNKYEPEFNRIDEKLIEYADKTGDNSIMANPDMKEGLKQAVDKKIITEAEAKTYLRYSDSERFDAVKDAPFKSSWMDLILKRLIRQAVEEGKDAISWTPGQAQADRYNLRHQVDKIEYMRNEDGTYELDIKGKNGENIPTGEKYYTKDTLKNLVGKEMADKIIKDDGKKSGNKTVLEGNDLEIGGEFHKKTYDEIAVNKANAIVKKFGGRVEEREINTSKVMRAGPQDWRVVKDNKGLNKSNGEPLSFKTEAEADAYAKANAGQPIWVLRLTPELKKAAMEKGFSMFEMGLPLSPVPGNPFSDQQKKYKFVPIQGNPFK